MRYLLCLSLLVFCSSADATMPPGVESILLSVSESTATAPGYAQVIPGPCTLSSSTPQQGDTTKFTDAVYVLPDGSTRTVDIAITMNSVTPPGGVPPCCSDLDMEFDFSRAVYGFPFPSNKIVVFYERSCIGANGLPVYDSGGPMSLGLVQGAPNNFTWSTSASGGSLAGCQCCTMFILHWVDSSDLTHPIYTSSTSKVPVTFTICCEDACP